MVIPALHQIRPIGITILLRVIQIPIQAMRARKLEIIRQKLVVMGEIELSIQDQEAVSTTSTIVAEKFMFQNSKRSIIFLTLSFLPIMASAAWEFGMTTASGDTIFFDQARIKRQGNQVSVWFMTNFAEPLRLSKGVSKSSVDSTEYDCANKTRRITYMSNFSSSNAQGELLQVFDQSELSADWKQIAPNSTADVFSNYFCKLKK
jgi:hypothetical protein